MINYFKLAFMNPLNILEGRKMDRNTAVKYFMIIVGIFLFPTLLTLPSVFTQFQDDITEVNTRIPEFEMNNGEIQINHESYIHLTETTTLFFDPNDELANDDLIARNIELGFSPFNIALQKDQLYFNINGVEQSINYSSFPEFNYNELTDILNSLTETSILVVLVTLFILFGVSALLLLYQFLLVGLSNYFITIFNTIKLKMSDVFKISLLAITLPTVALTITRLLNITSTYSIQLFTFFSISLYFFNLLRVKMKNKET